MIDDVAPDQARRELSRRGQMCARKWPPKMPTSRYTAPGRTRNHAARKCRLRPQPFWLKMSYVRLALTGPARVLEEGLGRVPAAVLVVPADRQLEERRREVVARVAPVEPRVRHQDLEAAEHEHEDAHRDDPVGDPDPARVALPRRPACPLPLPPEADSRAAILRHLRGLSTIPRRASSIATDR